MRVKRPRRSHSTKLLFLGAATLLSGCHGPLFVPNQSDLYPSPDRNPNAPPQRYATEADCIESLGADYCQRVVETAPAPQATVNGDSMAAVGYTDEENFDSIWLSPYSLIPPYTYWISRGGGQVAGGIVRGGFGRSATKFGSGALS
jgi:hypothetical protein